MEKKILSLNAEGKLVVKSVDGNEQAISPKPGVVQRGRAIVYLLVDCSSSMAGQKIEEAKNGALDFARSAFRKGYRVGLIRFETAADLICEPTTNINLISGAIGKLMPCGLTNLTDALSTAFHGLSGEKGYRVTVVVTDGCPTAPGSALEIAGKMKRQGIEILSVATSDADQDFLARLVSRKDLNLKVERNEFRKGMDAIARKLPTHLLEDKT